jgi:peptide/nickel transport system permease protein
MARLIVHRLVQSVPTMIGITVLTFVLLHAIPGGPAEVMLGQRATPALIAQVNRALGLDRPLPVQYLTWVLELVRGNFGYAYTYHATVLSLILGALPRTLVLVTVAIVLSHLLSIVLGMLQTVLGGSWFDYGLTVGLYFLYAMPGFWLAMLAIEVVSFQFHLLPSSGISSDFAVHPTLADYLDHLVLPDLVLVLGTVAGWTRYMRTAMAETMAEDYIRTARAKGASEARVLVHHALKNSLRSLVTLAGLSLPALFGGALIIEMVFNYPGMGLLFWTAAQNRDYPILLGITVIIGALTILGNLLADVAYAALDPRIQYR